MNTELDLLKIKLLDMLKVFHTFCVDNNLRYYAIGGTILGALRHQGFIPWDDDIDLGMPRADYEKLKAICSKLGNDNYTFEFPEAKDFVYPYCKMYDKSTTLVENTRYKTKRGLYLDIFPIDGIGDTKSEAVDNFSAIDNYVNLFETKVCALRKGRKLYKNLAICFMRMVPNCIVGREKLLNQIETKCKLKDFDSSVYVANCVGNWHEKEISLRQHFGEPKLYDFENIKIFGPEMADEYLTGVYGDWRRLPPIEKQVSHHDYIEIDLNKSYLEK